MKSISSRLLREQRLIVLKKVLHFGVEAVLQRSLFDDARKLGSLKQPSGEWCCHHGGNDEDE